MKKNKVFLSILTMCLLLNLFFGFAMPCYAADSVNYCGDKAFVRRMRQECSGNVSQGSGKKYYVSVNGDDRGKGSKSKPFRTFAKALKKLKPGDTLYVRKGTYKENIVIPAKCCGTKDKYITICSYANEKVVLNGKSGKSKTILTVNGASYLRIAGLEFANLTAQDACGIFVAAGTNHLILSGNTFHDIKVNKPTKQNHCANGILLYGDGSQKAIQNILIYGNRLYNCQTGWAECISVTANCKNINVVQNTIDKTGNIGIDFSGNYGYCADASKDFPRNCLAYKNKVTNCVSPNETAYGIYVDGGQHIEISGNNVVKCSGGIEIGAEEKPTKGAYSTTDIQVLKNNVKNNSENGITVGGYQKNLGWVNNVTITGNTCKNNGKKNVILTLAKCNGVTLQDNTFCNDSGGAAIVYSEFNSSYTKNIVFKNNRYSNGNAKKRTCFVYLGKTYTSFETWKKVVGKNAGTYQE